MTTGEWGIYNGGGGCFLATGKDSQKGVASSKFLKQTKVKQTIQDASENIEKTKHLTWGWGRFIGPIPLRIARLCLGRLPFPRHLELKRDINTNTKRC